MAATDIKIDRVETEYVPDDTALPYHTIVHATIVDGLVPTIFTVKYADPDGLLASILASPTVDGGEVVDFLP